VYHPADFIHPPQLNYPLTKPKPEFLLVAQLAKMATAGQVANFTPIKNKCQQTRPVSRRSIAIGGQNATTGEIKGDDSK